MLDEAKLIGTDLIGAKLNRASLDAANLIGADLSGSDFGRAFLDRANLIGANLRDANLRGATVRWATLRGAKNLDVQQLCKALTLYEAELDQEHKELILRDYSHLLEDPDKDI
jgi:uncharacterized protein YjbI with pentapeptide repeats